MGLLDSFLSGSQGGYGGLLDALMYPSPLTKPEEIQQPQYDPMGNYTGITPQASNPFGQPPAFDPRQFAPQSVFNGNMASSAVPFSAPMQSQVPALPPAQTVAPAPQPAPPQNRPTTTLDVGGYQMPQFGQQQAAQVQPSTDLSAQSRQAPALQDLPPAFGGGGYLSRINSGGSLIGSLLGDSPQQQNLKAEYDATRQMLIDNGVPAAKANSTAMLAVMNKDVGKTILPELFTNKQKFQVVREDPFTGKTYGFVNDRDQTINDKPLNSPDLANSGGSLQGLQAAQDAGIKGDALYSYLPKTIAPTVKAMIEGRQPLPSTAAMRSPATLALIDAAHSIDPTFDATVWKSRNDAGPDWTKGKSSEMVRAANQTLAHVGSLMNAMDDLKNTRFPAYNAVGNIFNEQLGKGEPGAFRTNAHAVAEEMSKVFKGANLSDSEIRHWEQNLSENMSPEQQRAQIGKLSELLHGSLQALEEKRLTAMGPAQAEKAGPLIKEEGQKVLQRIDSWLNKNGAASTGNQTKTGVSWSVVK